MLIPELRRALPYLMLRKTNISETYPKIHPRSGKDVRITWGEAEPVDFVIYSDNSHIGIVAGEKDKNMHA